MGRLRSLAALGIAVIVLTAVVGSALAQSNDDSSEAAEPAKRVSL